MILLAILLVVTALRECLTQLHILCSKINSQIESPLCCIYFYYILLLFLYSYICFFFTKTKRIKTFSDRVSRVLFQICVSPDSRNTSWVSFDGRNRQELFHGDRYVQIYNIFLTFSLQSQFCLQHSVFSDFNCFLVIEPIKSRPHIPISDTSHYIH